MKMHFVAATIFLAVLAGAAGSNVRRRAEQGNGSPVVGSVNLSGNSQEVCDKYPEFYACGVSFTISARQHADGSVEGFLQVVKENGDKFRADVDCLNFVPELAGGDIKNGVVVTGTITSSTDPTLPIGSEVGTMVADGQIDKYQYILSNAGPNFAPVNCFGGYDMFQAFKFTSLQTALAILSLIDSENGASDGLIHKNSTGTVRVVAAPEPMADPPKYACYPDCGGACPSWAS